jgi:hypothetical protein
VFSELFELNEYWMGRINISRVVLLRRPPQREPSCRPSPSSEALLPLLAFPPWNLQRCRPLWKMATQGDGRRAASTRCGTP